MSQAINVHPPRAQPGFSFVLGAQKDMEGGRFQAPGLFCLVQHLENAAGPAGICAQCLGDSGVTLGLAGDVG